MGAFHVFAMQPLLPVMSLARIGLFFVFNGIATVCEVAIWGHRKSWLRMGMAWLFEIALATWVVETTSIPRGLTQIPWKDILFINHKCEDGVLLNSQAKPPLFRSNMRPSKREDHPRAPLLSPSTHKDDASSLRSVSNQDSDSEDDEVIHGARTSLEIAEHDRTVLEEEDEREKLLASGGAGDGFRRIFSISNSSKVVVGKRERRKQKREKRKAMKRQKRRDKGISRGEEQEFMIEMEEGGLGSDTGSESSEQLSDIDRQKLRNLDVRESRSSRRCKYALVHVTAITVFLIFLLGAYQVSRNRLQRGHGSMKLLNNGTSNFRPTTILISLDGFRADFLNRGLTPTLNLLIAQGISPRYMTPSFPSVTFPNHYTLVTGLYPESHGIVGNSFWDPDFQQEFYYVDRSVSMLPKWWGGEPLWATAENAGVKTAIHMWPGSEAHIGGVEPTFVDSYDGSELLSRKVDRILGFIDIPGPGDGGTSVGDERPQFIAVYVPVVDSDGHKYGPNSTEIQTTISDVDQMLNDLFSGLQARNLTDVVNVVVVSDHGMATTSTDRLIQLEDLIDIDQIEHTDGWPLYGLRPKDPNQLPALYDKLKEPSPMSEHFEVYLRDRDMPERYHFSKNKRIAPLWIVPETGWAIVTKKEFDIKEAKATGREYDPKGLHGYDHEHPLMRAIFIARGPAFPHKPNSRVDVFQNIEVYNIVCDSLFITPRPNNGTLRLPLKPIGLHSDPDSLPLETPPDPFPSTGGDGNDQEDPASASTQLQPIETTSLPTEISKPIGVDNPSDDIPTPAAEDEKNQMDEIEKEENRLKKIWNYIIVTLTDFFNNEGKTGGDVKAGGESGPG
ncbi:hypothetical protein FGG08_007101 [Glutinoglossum americanum]|uniref:Uncharacterized protein n=1 Tax=Glutinoglossum americanum TaxID=1670608 RepID=A0A9P8HX01_9PEZI|nr:hypothetical protein FGG08_007101 [Glutinoglossum americanum]